MASAEGPPASSTKGGLSRLFVCGGKKKKNKRGEKETPATRPYTWPVPYLSRLEGSQLQAGQSLIVRGYMTPSAVRFDINLTAGENLEANEEHGADDILLTVSNRLSEKRIVLNSYSQNVWGKEVVAKSNLLQQNNEDGAFDFRIRAHQDFFELFVNRQLLNRFDYRLPLSRLNHVYVTGDVELSTVSWEGKYYAVPYDAGIPDNFCPGRKLFVSGQVDKAAGQYQINLLADDDVAFHLNVRYNEKAVVRNARVAEKWGDEERGGQFPFRKPNTFDVLIACEEDAYLVFVDDEMFCVFKHRTDPRNTQKLSVSGDIGLLSVSLK